MSTWVTEDHRGEDYERYVATLDLGDDYEGISVGWRRHGSGVYWLVELPHQCDQWEIANTTTREEAIADLEQFVAEAQEALAQLRQVPAPA